MNAELGYVNADDGTLLAFSVAGEGPPLLCMEIPFWSHVGMEQSLPPFRAWYGRLASMFRVVRFDYRGSGASQRDVSDIGFERLCMDVLAVVDHLEIERFSILARDASGPLAVALAANNPGRVQHLILYGTWAVGRRHPLHERIGAMESLIDVDWRLYTEVVTTVMANVGPEAVAAAGYLRRCVEPDVWKRASNLVASFDATNSLPRVACPVLVVHPDNDRLAPFAGATDLAAGIRGARLAVAKGVNLPFEGIDTTARLIAEFMGVEPTAHPHRGEFRTILFTDIEGHAAMMSRLGDERAREVLREHERVTREALAAHGGQEVKSMGDGFLASFTSAQQAIECIVSLQRRVAHGVAGEPIRIRAGINAGEPISEDDDLFGWSVVAASRIAGKAEGGQVLVSDVVRQLVAGKGFAFRDLGLHELKGLGEPVRVWELALQ